MNGAGGSRPNAPVMQAGWVGVDLFFILSGFILMHAHRKDFADSPLRAVPKFFWSRFLRVYPLNAAVLLMIAALMAIDTPFADAYAAQAPGNLSLVAFIKTLTLSTRWLLPGRGEWNEPVWSLSAEVLGYLVFPLLAWLLCKVTKGSEAILLGCLGLLMIYLARLHQLGENLAFGQGAVIRMMLEFVAGMALYRFRIANPLTADGARRIATASSVLIVACIFVLKGTAIMPLMFCGLIYALSFNPRGLVGGLLSSRAIVHLGRISFPLYLVHIAPLGWMNYHGFAVPYQVQAALYFAAMLMLATALHYLVEVRFIEMARRRPAAVALGAPAVGTV
jgi:peptidoglycan/LPS O-acetylase OafA/YrhL